MDSTAITISIFQASVIAASVVSSVVGALLWSFNTFEKKNDARDKHKDLEGRVSASEKVLHDVAKDVSYIRGRLEPK